MAPPARKDGGKAAGKSLLRLTQKRLEGFVGILPKFLVNDDPKLIHDLRVRSRRLQQTLRIALPRPRSRQTKKIIKTVRGVRRALSACRNLDVNLALARERAAHSAGLAEASTAWNAFIKNLSGERPFMVAQARQRIGKHNLAAFITHTQSLLKNADFAHDPLADMSRALHKSLAQWDEAYATADKKRDTEEIHSLRIAGKRLRYRAELLVEMGLGRVKKLAQDLKQIRDTLGSWHDSSVLVESIAGFVRRPKLVEQQPAIAAALLAEMDKEQKRAGTFIDQFFTDTPSLRKRWRGLNPGARARKRRVRKQSENPPE